MSPLLRPLALVSLLVLCSTGCEPEDALEEGLDDANAGQGPDAGFAPQACTVKAPTECPSTPPRFDDVKPIFEKRCAGCHSGDWAGPWPLDTYAHVADWSDVIRSHLIDCSMPPPEAGMPLPDEESLTILTWIRCDTPR